MKKILPIIFFGSSEFSVYVLKEFIKKYKPLLVITLKAKPAGRGLKLQPNPVYTFCLKEKLSIIEFEDWEKFKKDFELLKPLAGVIVGFSKIISQEIISLFPKGILNVHPSLLPKYRGPNPIREVILNNEKESGVTLILIDELIDHGPIIYQKTLPLLGKETYKELEEKLGKLGGEVLNEKIESYLEGKEILVPQNEALATYTKKINKEDGFLNLNDDYEIWDKKIRALNPWPGTFIKINDKIIKIFKIEKLKIGDLPKEILKTNVGEFFTFKNELGIRLSNAFVFIKEIQLEGKKRMSGKEFLNGFRKLIFN